MGYRQIVAAAASPVTVAELKAYLVIEHSDDDAVLAEIINAATELAEHETGGTAIMPQTWQLTLDGWPSDPVELRPGPVSAVSEARYLDSDGVQQTLAASVYQLQNSGLKAYFRLAYNQSWPDAQPSADAIEIDYVTGYADAASAPSALKKAIMLIAGDLYENKEGQSIVRTYRNDTVRNLLATHLIPSV